MPRARRYLSDVQRFRRALGRLPMRVNPFAQHVVQRPEPLPQAALYWYWHPEREGVEPCPPEWDRRVKLIHPGLAICRPPPRIPKARFGADQRWIIWQRDATVQHPICKGWKLLFLWPPRDYAPIPLDNRVLANLAIIDPRRYANGLDYFDTVIKASIDAEKAASEKAQKQYRHDHAHDLFDSHKISTAAPGNRFALHHDGTIVPSRGEQNWLGERAKHMLPSDHLKAEAEHQKRKKR